MLKTAARGVISTSSAAIRGSLSSPSQNRPGRRELPNPVAGRQSLMVGKAYLDMHEAQPGDHFTIRLGRDSIRLVPLDEI